MRSLCCLKSRVRRVQHALQSAGLGLLVLAGTVGAADKARAQDEASVLLCDLTYTVKLKRLKRSFAPFSSDFAELWSAQREGDKRDKCKRYFQMVEPNSIYSSYGATYNYVHWTFSPEMRANPTLAGTIVGTSDGVNTRFAQRYSSGSNYAYFKGSSTKATADAEL